MASFQRIKYATYLAFKRLSGNGARAGEFLDVAAAVCRMQHIGFEVDG